VPVSYCVELDRVSVRYGEVVALEDVDLAVDAGDFLGVIGPNGSGKTTLIRVMLGLLAPVAGQVRLFGRPPAAFRQWERLGYVPQRVNLDTGLPATVEEVVTTGLVSSLGVLGRVRASDRSRVRGALDRVAMAEHAGRRIADLSAGQQQRVLIARALVSAPELLVLDEPTGGIDPEAQSSLYGLLRHLNREQGVTLVLVSHDIAVVAHEVTKVACLNRRLVYHGPPADFMTQAALATLYGPSVRFVSHEHP
jgi:zinc transport system ATP-binding protein